MALRYQDPMILDQYSYTPVFEDSSRYHLVREIDYLQQEIMEESDWANTYNKIMANEHYHINELRNRLSLVHDPFSLEAQMIRAGLSKRRCKYYAAQTNFMNASGRAKTLSSARRRMKRKLDSIEYYLD